MQKPLSFFSPYRFFLGDTFFLVGSFQGIVRGGKEEEKPLFIWRAGTFWLIDFRH